MCHDFAEAELSPTARAVGCRRWRTRYGRVFQLIGSLLALWFLGDVALLVVKLALRCGHHRRSCARMDALPPQAAGVKAAIVLAAYVGLSNLLFLGQVLGEIRAAGNSRAMILTYAVWGLGALGQAAAIFPCLCRLAPVQVSGPGKTMAASEPPVVVDRPRD